MGRFEALRVGARRRLRRRSAGERRVVIQDGHCARAAGSDDVGDALAKALTDASGAIVTRAGCDGACFLAPRVAVQHAGGGTLEFVRVAARQVSRIARRKTPGAGRASDRGPFWSLQHRLVLEGCGDLDPVSLDEYVARGGYQGLANALGSARGGPESVIDEVLKADLRGRGGAYFPTARKWQAARAVASTPRYVVVNAEEGEPGIFKDRHIMEGVPHRLVEGLLIAGYATGAAKGFIYINAEAGLSAERVQRAVDEARKRGIIGESVLGSDFSFEVEVRRGAGGYVCGEETTLLNTIEGHRRVPRLRPPFPTEAGLWQRPTVINNVETLCNVPWIMVHGADAFREIGKGAPGTKLISLSGAVQRPGLVEVPIGTTLRQIVYEVGGGAPPGRRVVGVVAGGPSGGLLPEAALDVAIGPGRLHESGAVLGSGGVVVIDDSVPIAQVVRKLAAYNAAESCGKCTPCREGTVRMVEALDRLVEGRGRAADLEELRSLADVVSSASLCGLGQMAGGPVTSALHFFGEDFARLAGVT